MTFGPCNHYFDSGFSDQPTDDNRLVRERKITAN